MNFRSLSAERRSALARTAARRRWHSHPSSFADARLWAKEEALAFARRHNAIQLAARARELLNAGSAQ